MSFFFLLCLTVLYFFAYNRGYKGQCKHKEYILSKQLLRCGTSIGANVAEAQKAQSKADFYAKMCIALKETSETMYWLKLLHRTDFLDKAQFTSLHTDATELLYILTAICKTTAQSK